MKFKKTIALLCCVALFIGGTIIASAQLKKNNVSYLSGTNTDTTHALAAADTGIPEKTILFSNAGFTQDDLRSNDQNSKPLLADNVNNNDATKEYIYDRMLNTVDYFTYVSGSYKHYCTTSNDNYTLEYNVKMDGAPKAYEKLIEEGDTSIRENYYNGSQFYRYLVDTTKLNSQDASSASKLLSTTNINISKTKSTDFISLVKATSRYKVGSDNIPTIYYRTDTTMTSYAREVIFPQERTIGCLHDFSTWNIASNEKILDRDCIVIKGSLSGDYSNKLNTKDFTFWVDSQTGILLKLEGYNANGDLVESIISTSFNLGPIDDSTMSKIIESNIPNAAK